MTRDELNRKRMMFQIYANRNQVPKMQINSESQEPIKHSATNEFLEYRKKVAAGVKLQKENNKSNLFNVTAANEQYRQDLMKENIIVHAGTGEFKPTYYQKVENAFGPGKHRYFYTKEEWDAYQNELAGFRKKAENYVKNRDANNNSGANRAANDSKVANDQKAEKRAANLQANQAGREAAIKNSETTVSKEKFEKRVAKDKEYNSKNAAQKLGNKVKSTIGNIAKAETIKSDADRWNKYDLDIRNSVVENNPKYANIKTQKDFLKAAEEAGGVDKFYDNLESEIRKAQNNRDSSNNPGADRAAKEKANNTKTSNKEPEVSKEYKEEKEYNTTGKSPEKSSNTGDSAAERQKKILDDAFKEGANADELASKYGVSKEYIQEMVYGATGKKIPTKKEMESKNSGNSGSNKTGTTSKEYQQEMESNSKKNDYELKSGPSNNSSSNSSGYYFTVENGKTVKKAKHDGLEDGITTSAELTPEQEYLNFRAKVEAGLKHFGMTRGLMSVPVNQGLKNGESLAHAGMTNKYYAKLDDFWGKGKPRYFYSKEEWDGYQKNKQGNNQAGADRAAKQKEEASKPVTKPNIDRSNLLNKAQSGRESAINNSSPLTNSSSSNSVSGNPIKKLGTKLIDAINNKGTSDKVVTTVVIEDNTPEIVKQAQSGREKAEKEATKRTMTTMAYDKAIKDYDEVAKEIDKEYGFDKLDPNDEKAVNKAWQKLIKDTAKVIDSGKVANPDGVKYEYVLKDDDKNSYAYAAYIQEYASESLRLNSIYNDLKNEYAKTLQDAQWLTDFNAIAESNKHASELFDQMQDVREQINENNKESDSKVIPYLTAVYKELL